MSSSESDTPENSAEFDSTVEDLIESYRNKLISILKDIGLNRPEMDEISLYPQNPLEILHFYDYIWVRNRTSSNLSIEGCSVRPGGVENFVVLPNMIEKTSKLVKVRVKVDHSEAEAKRITVQTGKVSEVHESDIL